MKKVKMSMENKNKRPINWAFFAMNLCKSYFLSCILLGILLFTPLDVQAEMDLQAIIHEAPAHSVIELEAKEYSGPITISKPLTIQGTDGTIITSDTEGIEIIGTEQVVIKKLEFRTKKAPIKLTDSIQSTFEDLVFHVLDEGMILREATDLTLRNVEIFGLKDAHFSKKANGIESYEVTRLLVENTKASNLQDALYFERVKDVSVQNTHVSKGRYGLHFMYAENVTLQKNVVENNVTGFMLMIVEQLKLEQNVVQKQRALNSNGLYLYDIQQAEIRNNTFRENTVGTVWKSVSSATFSQNVFQMNGTAIEAEKSPEVLIQRNQFLGNILAARSDENGFELNQNQYDDYAGNDFNGDGIGDTHHYALKSFGQWMVRKPVYQYFIEAPSVVILNKMDNEIQTKDQQLLVDEQPVMNESKKAIQWNMDWGQFAIGTAGLSLIWILRRKLK